MRIMRSLIAICLFASVSMAADIAGRWKLVASAPDGNAYNVTLVLKDDGGKLTGVMESDMGQMPVANVAHNGNGLRFDLMLDMGPIPFRLKIDGNKVSGTLTAPDGSSGSVSGERDGAAVQASADGKWEITAADPDGTPRRATLELRQAGGGVSGSLALDTGDTLPISAGKQEGDTVRFKVFIGDGDIEVAGRICGDAVSGEYKLPTGETGKFTGKRAASASLSGRWNVIARDAEGDQMRSTLDLRVDGDRLTGTITTESGDSAPLIEGKVQGDAFRFKIYTGDGNIEVHGRMDNGKVAGEYTTPNGSKGTWTATRMTA